MKKTILYFISSSEIGGAQRHIEWLLQGCIASSYKTVVACLKGPLLKKIEDRGIEVIAVNFNILGWIRLTRIIARIRPNIIHFHLLRAALFGLTSSFLAKGVGRIYTVHNMVVYPRIKPWKRLLYPLVTRIIAAWMDNIIVVSDEMKVYFEKSLNISKHKVKLIYNGVSFSSLEQSRERAQDLRLNNGIPANTQLIGAVGRVTYEKGYDLLLNAFKIVSLNNSSVCCIVVGDGPKRAEIEKKAYEVGLHSRFRFVGFQQDILSWLSIMDIVVSPSRTEGFPLAVIEAAYAYKPIIATRVGGAKAILVDELSGIFVPTEDTDSLAQAINKLLNEPTIRELLGKNAHLAVVSRFDMKNCRQQTRQVYEDILSNSKSTI